MEKYRVTKEDFKPLKKMYIKSIKIPKELMDKYSIVLKELERTFSADVKFLIKMRIVSSQVISIEEKKKILAEIEREMKKK